MKKKLNSILLVDDDNDCNFFHQRLINKMECSEKVVVAFNGQEALDFLTAKIDDQHPRPAIIFLDINMPVMNGWDFLKEYEKLDESVKAEIVLIMLTTSLNPDDREKALNIEHVNGFEQKYLSKESIEKILSENFPEYFE